MPWPAYVFETFDVITGGVNAPTDGLLFCGPYNTLLAYLFPPTEHYTISPPEGWPIDFITVFIVQKAFRPVFSRAAADNHDIR